MADWDVEAKHPDDFLVDQFHLDAVSVHKSIQAVADSWQSRRAPSTKYWTAWTVPDSLRLRPSYADSRANPGKPMTSRSGGYASHDPRPAERGYFGHLRCSEPWRHSS